MSDHKSHQSQISANARTGPPRTIAVSTHNPADCTPAHACGGHSVGHAHGPGCAHEVVKHGDHTDYVVDGRLHHPCAKRCDDHGPVEGK